MVMDATPSPQSVGREFVRQYYTLLNKAPNHLHRFYNNHSSFVHGGLDQHNRDASIVVGQKNIHNKIQQLNFRDCHAKISQVDSQATLGNGVVVQVTGELSNDGQPMRRFTQTFVLAAQSPKKYYVHNDIFRYQDFYSDDEVEVESGGRSENDEELQESEAIDTSANISQPPQIFYPLGVPTPTPGQTVPIQPFAQPPQMNGVVHEDILQGIQGQPGTITIPMTPAAVQTPPQQPPVEATVIAMEPVAVATSPIPSSVNVSAPPVVEEPMESPDPIQPVEAVIIPETTLIIEQEPEPVKIEKIEPIKTVEDPLKVIAAEPKTYANLVKSSVSGFSFAAAMTSSPPSIVSGNSTRQNTLSPPPHRYQQDDSRRTDSRNESGPLPQRANNRSLNRERRSSNTNNQTFGDSHQLFVGNVPHHATEDELRTLFSKFGTVAELRILSKAGQKVPGGRAPPNYGFITYDDPESVQNCLTNTPLFYPDNSPDGQKLNIEEKKIRSWAPNESGGGGGGGQSNTMRGNSGTPSRSGGSGGGGGVPGGSSVRGGSNQGLSRGGSGGRGGGGGGGGRSNFNRTDRGGSSATRTGGNSGTPNTNYGRR